MGPAPATGWPPTPWPCGQRGEESGRDLPVSSAQDKEQLQPAPDGILAQPRSRLPPKPELPHQLATMSGRGVSAKGLAQSPESLLPGDAGPLAPLGAPSLLSLETWWARTRLPLWGLCSELSLHLWPGSLVLQTGQ